MGGFGSLIFMNLKKTEIWITTEKSLELTDGRAIRERNLEYGQEFRHWRMNESRKHL
jgi:hypothetical protein